jgi:hypothetical protein
MKRTLLFVMAVFLGFAVMAQHYTLKPNVKTEKARTANKIGFEPTNASSLVQAKQIATPAAYKNTDFVNIVTFGSSANGYTYGYAGGQKSIVYANTALNTVCHFHRMGGTLDPGGYSGDLGYDISTDGGMTWTAMHECYKAVNNAGGTYYTDAARYPNHGIYNPAGNTDPNNAYVTYFAPTLDGSNGAGSWGGYAYGRAKVGTPTDTLRTLKPSRPGEGIFQYIPDGYCVTSLGEVWAADFNQDWTTGAIAYQGTMLINHGVWDAGLMDFVYTEELIDCPTIDNSRPALIQIEFSPDGLTGYICVLADNGEVPFAAGTSYFPILWKTTDAGQTWSDPISVSLGGSDGIGGVLNYLTDAQIAELFLPPLPSREEIPFTTAFDFDLSVDGFGNPHIAVVVGVTGADAYSISSAYPFTSAMDITSLDGGNTWIAYDCGRPYTFRGLFPDDTYSEDNRIQIARNPAGTKIFVSWIATFLPGITDNNQPDIFTRGIDIVNHLLTTRDSSGVLLDQPINVTEFTEGMWQAFMGSMASEVLESNGSYTIPMTYLSTGASTFDPVAPVVFKYIQDFKFSEADFNFVGIDENPQQVKAAINVSQNFPNPTNGETSVTFSLNDASTVGFEVVNMMGQKVYDVPAVTYGSGIHAFTFNASSLANGVYFYTVTAGEEKITKKMIVK